ncbi:MAG: hypothetical protein CVV02_01610 [Firmicutes bacterium HGW-Firmicutes-7]|nr:MAG: hypothetical protein CVV02_01610 [Firmicutes bacterium HGW-Firmicutes-7]
MIKNLTNIFIQKTNKVYGVIKSKLSEENGFVEEALKILIAVVIGALMLAGLYFLFNTIILPTLNERVTDMFNYAG